MKPKHREQEIEELTKAIKKTNKLIHNLLHPRLDGEVYDKVMNMIFGIYLAGEEMGKLQAKKEFEQKLNALIDWGNKERLNNNIFCKSEDELNDSWIDKIEELNSSKQKEKKE